MSDLAERRAYSAQTLSEMWDIPADHITSLMLAGRMRAFSIGKTPQMLRVPVDEAARVGELLKAGEVPPQIGQPIEFKPKPRNPREPRGPIPTVYFIDCGEFTKIGFTAQYIEQRVDNMRTANPFPIKLWAVVPGTTAIEREFHDIFGKYRHQREWFRLDDAARAEVIEEIKRRRGKVFKRPKNV